MEGKYPVKNHEASIPTKVFHMPFTKTVFMETLIPVFHHWNIIFTNLFDLINNAFI